MNSIVYGDNLTVLKTIPASSVNLIYIDPPFNTGKTQTRQQIVTIRDAKGDRTGFQGIRYRSIKVGSTAYQDSFADYQGFLATPFGRSPSSTYSDWESVFSY